MKLGPRWTQAVANQYSVKTLKIIPYGMLAVLVICLVLAGLGATNLSFSLLTLDFFMLADYFTVRLTQRRIQVILSGILGTLGAAIIFGVITLALGLLFKW